MFHRGWFWIDSRAQSTIESVVHVVRCYGVARVGDIEGDIVEHLQERGRWAGLIVWADENRLPLLERIRASYPLLPILAMVEVPQRRLLNVLQARDIEVVALPVEQPSVTSFVQRAFTATFLPDERVARTVAQLADHAHLTAREVQLIAFCLGNEPRERVRRRLGISENTLKTQVKGLLRKCNERNVDALAKNVLRAAFLLDQPVELAEPIAPWLKLASAS